MTELSDLEIDAALEQGAKAFDSASASRAKSVRYDEKSVSIVVELMNGCTFILPTALVPAFAEASAAELNAVVILGDGYGLHWEPLDVDFSVAGLLAGKFTNGNFRNDDDIDLDGIDGRPVPELVRVLRRTAPWE